MVDYTEGRRENTKWHRGKAGYQVVWYSLRALPVVALWMVHFGLPAQQKPDSVVILSLYERFLNIKAEYRGAIASGDTAMIAEKTYLMGKRYFEFGDYYEARKWFFKALKLRTEKADPIHIAKIYSRLSYCEASELDWEKAMHYSRRSLEYILKSDDNYRIYKTGAYLEVGGYHLATWREAQKGRRFETFVPSLDSAFWYYRKARKLADEEGNQIQAAMATRFCGELLSEMGRIEEGIDSLKKAIDIQTAQGPVEAFSVAATALSIGEVYMRNGRLPEAGVWLNKAHVLVDTGNVRSYIALADVKKKLSEYYVKVGNWQHAYLLDQEADVIRTKELEAYRKSSREGLELLHENDLKMAELEASQRELRLQREKAKVRSQLQWIIGSALLLTLAAGIVLYRLYRKYKTVSIENARLVKEQSHRVKNNLQSIYNLLSLQMGQLSDPLAVAALEESLGRVDAITRVHRRLYEGNRLAEVELAAYVPDLVKGILRSYKMEHARQLYEVPEVWLHADTAIPLGLMISELTTNSCKYAFEGHASPALEIRCFPDDKGDFNFEYSDNGPGFDSTEAASSFGLRLIRLLAGQLKGEYAFSREPGSVFRLKFKEALKKATAPS